MRSAIHSLFKTCEYSLRLRTMKPRGFTGPRGGFHKPLFLKDRYSICLHSQITSQRGEREKRGREGGREEGAPSPLSSTPPSSLPLRPTPLSPPKYPPPPTPYPSVTPKDPPPSLYALALRYPQRPTPPPIPYPLPQPSFHTNSHHHQH